MSLLNSRSCVFCGKTAVEKNREHVLPQWLLARTGDPNRIVTHGLNYQKNKEPLQFSWSSLVAPACSACNESFSALENEAKRIVTRVENAEPVSVSSYVTLLDWLDKVRIGVWLLRHMIEKHPIAIEPNFHIHSRIRKKDRMLAIYRFPDQRDGLSVHGSDSMIFSEMPSCFGLRINQTLLVNISSDFFCSRGCGMPYPQYMQQQMGGEDSGKLKLSGVSGPHPVTSHVTKLRFQKPVLHLYQAIKMASEERQFQGGYYGHWNLTDTRTIPLTLRTDPALGALVRQFTNHVEILRNPDTPIVFNEVTGKDCAAFGDVIATVYDCQIQLFSNLQKEWIGPATPSPEYKALRMAKIESTKEFAAAYRAGRVSQ